MGLLSIFGLKDPAEEARKRREAAEQKRRSFFPDNWRNTWAEGVERVKAAMREDPLQITPLSMQERIVPAARVVGRALGKEKEAELAGYALQGATRLTPFQRGRATEAQTEAQQKAERIGKAAYGMALTAPLGGQSALLNMLTRAGQGAALGVGMKAAGNVLSGEGITKDLGQGAMSGLENSWQLAFTNAISDKVAGAFWPKLASSQTGAAFNLLKNASRMGAGSDIKRQLFTRGAITLFQRALLETGVENTWFTAADKLSGKEKESFIKTWVKNLPGTLLGNLAFAGADVSFRGAVNFNQKQVDQATEALKKTLSSAQPGFIKLGSELKPSKREAAKQHLFDFMRYSTDLLERGYTKAQVDLIPYSEYKKIVEANVSPLEHPSFAKSKMLRLNPEVHQSVRDFEFEMEQNKDVKKQVNLLDYLRTPERVLSKIGLGREAGAIRFGWENYKKELPVELGKINDWSKRAPGLEANERIFRWLDGEKIELEGEELTVAQEVKTYLKQWADRLGLPADKRVREYITHLFERGMVKQEFDPELAKLITDQVPGGVYDPFLTKRLGTRADYKKDVWGALEAYVKRGSRKVNMDPALKALKEASEKLDVESLKYVQRLGARINMRPTEADSLVDNLIKSSPLGYKYGQRPTAYLTQKYRQVVYRGALGLNVKSALRNLTQASNTYSKLGEKYTVLGYLDLLRKGAAGQLDELYEKQVLEDSFIRDRDLHFSKRLMDKVDKALFAMFDAAEKINRGSAYFGAKRKAMAGGMNEFDAADYAKKMVRDTQFTFGAIDTPVALSSDISKLLTQFGTYSIKQFEFLGEMAKNQEWGGLARYIGSQLVLIGVLGKKLGLEPGDMIPSWSMESPFIGTIKNLGGLVSGDEQRREEAKRGLVSNAALMVPGGVQAKRSLEGYQAVKRAASTTPSGRVRFDVEQTPENMASAVLFGEWSLPGAQDYLRKLQGKPPAGLSKEEKQAWREVNQLRDQATERTTAEAQAAQEIWDAIKSLPVEGQRAEIAKLEANGQMTEAIFTRLEDLRKEAERGWTETEKKIYNLGPVEEAKFHWEKMKPMSYEDQKKYIADLDERGLLTDPTFEELLKIREGAQ